MKKKTYQQHLKDRAAKLIESKVKIPEELVKKIDEVGEEYLSEDEQVIYQLLSEPKQET